MKGKFMLIPEEILGDSRLKPLDMVVYGTLDSFADSDGKAWPSIPTIAERGSVSSATVKRALSRLESAGYINRRQRCKPGTKEFDSTLYMLSFRSGSDGSERTGEGSCVSEVGSLKYGRSVLSVQEVGSDRAGNYTHRTITNEPYCVGDSSPTHTGSVTAVPVPVTHVTITTETQLNDTGEKESEGENSTTEHTANVERHFNELWESYPRKSARGKAKKTFMALFPAELSPERVMQRLETMSKQFAIFEQEAEKLISRGQEQYIPYLHNWLVREGFADV
ncbi:MAG: helix-turn-helix domain-containing protein [Synergistaceae bacterium]|nr:helix-turn-helix domain-containing protein [Synergistaceae bacterium]